MNFYLKEGTVVSRSCNKKLLVETVAYVFTDIPFLDSHSPYFFKKWLKVAQRMKHRQSYLNMDELKRKVGLRVVRETP